MTDLTVARTILDQLGGSQFLAMCGAKHLTGHPDALTFRLPGGMFSRSINYVKIRLTGRDDYDLTFSRIHKVRGAFTETKIAERNGIYCDQLQDVFTTVTGLDTHF
jgi:hypothetical protein